jgi:protein LSM14
MSGQEHYIGSKISLISQAEIRYEGVLMYIDQIDSTITLQNVVSFGTEGRRQVGVQIPPSSEVYESITFKGDDIKDLTIVVEPVAPAPIMQQQYYQQPQYYQQQPQYGGYGYAPPQQAYMGYQQPQAFQQPQPGYGAPPPAWGQPVAQPVAQQPSAPIPQDMAPQPPSPAPIRPPVPQQEAPAQPKKPAWGNPNPPKEEEGVILPAARNAKPIEGVAKAAATVPIQPAAPKPKPTSFAAAALNALAPEEVARLKSQPKAAAPAQSGVPAPRTGGRDGGRGVVRGGARPPSGPTAAGPEVPKEEFNFEKMLQKFNKEKLMQSAEAKKAVQSQPVYNKDDFFDTMSSEASEKEQGGGNRSRFQEQRRTDALTFGFNAVTASHAAARAVGGRGGRDGGRGGRDGGRGRGEGRGGRGEGRGGRGGRR